MPETITIEEQIGLINYIIKECVIHGGDAGGAYFSSPKKVETAINLWLDKMGLKDKYKIITEERCFYNSNELFDIFPRIVPIDYDIMHPEFDKEKKKDGIIGTLKGYIIKGWGF